MQRERERERGQFIKARGALRFSPSKELLFSKANISLISCGTSTCS